MTNKTFNGRSLAFISIILTVIAGTLVFAMVQSAPRVEAQSGGGGRLLVASFGNSIFAANADPATDGPYIYDVVSHYPSNANTSFPSVSQANGKIAYLYQSGPVQRVWIMDADGSNAHQLTLGGDATFQDSNPIISPDGTKVAFRSNRFVAMTFSDGSQKQPEVFTINIDGSNLQQVTPSEQEPQHGSNPNTYVEDFGWSGTNLVVVGGRVVPGQPALKYGIFRYNTDGSGQITIKITGGTGFNNAQSFDVSRDGSKLAYSNVDRIFIFDAASGNQTGQLDSNTSGAGVIGQSRGGIRFSPDGTRILYAGASGTLRTIGLDGSNPQTVRSDGGFGQGRWWYSASPIPAPARLKLTPGVLVVPNDGTPAQITPTLYDANNNVIFHAAQYTTICDATHNCNINANPFGAFQFNPIGKISVSNPGSPPTGYVTVCGNSAGLQGCIFVGVNRELTFAEINASVPSVNTNGTGGPGVFTIRRQSTIPGNQALTIDFTLGGTAVRNVDYSLNVAGNSIIIPTGQETIDIRVTPLTASGNKTITLSITGQVNGTYVTQPTNDHATVNIVDNGSVSAALALTSVDPITEGNAGYGGVTVYGRNIHAGASLRLTRAAQSDIVCNAPMVGTGGNSIYGAFDFIGTPTGAWNVVVINPGGETAQLTNGLTIVADSQPRLQLVINGPSEVRASHHTSHYDVIYSNVGNADAFGVFLFITGISPTQCNLPDDPSCTYFETPLLPVPDVPGQPPFPSFVHGVPNITPIDIPELGGPGIRHAGAVAIFIPRISANSSGVFRFTMRFQTISQSGFLQIGAALTPPLLKAVHDQGGLSLVPREPAYTGMRNNLGVAYRRAFGFDVGNTSLDSSMNIMNSIAQHATNSSLQSGDVQIISGAQVIGGIATGINCGGCGTIDIQIIQIIEEKIEDMWADDDDTGEDGQPNETWEDVLAEMIIELLQSADPNEKMGIRGSSPQNYIRGASPLQYGIDFENQPTATAPAQDVVVTDQLDPAKVDLSTFKLGPISFGNTFINVPPNLQSYTTEVDLRPMNDLLVEVSGQLDQNTGLVTWQFHSLDPYTRQSPLDPAAGFLPPDHDGMQGRGSVFFSISPKAPIVAGTEIRNQATIVFDLNAPLNTNEWLNTLDNSDPISSVSPLNAQQPSNVFTVDWSGTDTGSGIKDYTVYVSKNGGPFQPFEVYVPFTSVSFTGDYDTTYSFYSIARDGAGNVEGAKIVGEATTHTHAALATISGTVTYGNAVSGPAPPRYVSHVLMSGAGSPPVSVFTDAPGAGAGTYSLSGFGAGSYTVTPSKTGGVNTAISSFDAGLIAQHVAGINSLTGNQLIVADVSNNGTISSFDAGEIANYVVTSSPAGTAGTWRFSPVNRTYASITSNIAGEDYSALLMGEVSGNWANTGARPTGGRQSSVGGTRRTVSVDLPNIVTISGSQVVIPVEVHGAENKEIISYEFNLRYDPSVLKPEADPIDLSGTVSSDLSFAVNTEEPGILRVAVYGPMPISDNGILLNLKFTAVGMAGSASWLTVERLMFNEGTPEARITSSGRVKLSSTGSEQD